MIGAFFALGFGWLLRITMQVEGSDTDFYFVPG
jgi:hypothetical protein